MSTATTLSAIRQAIKDELVFDPKAKKYSNSLSRRIQRVYEEILDAEEWLFAQKTADVALLKTVAGSATQRFNATVATNARQVQAVTPFTVSAAWLGGVFVDSAGAEHAIIGVDEANGNIYLGTSLSADIDATNYESWSIRADTVMLPPDCKEVLGIMDRASSGIGRIVYVTRRQEEGAWLDKDTTGQPAFYIEDDQLTIRPPTETLSVATVASGGTLPARTWEYRYTIRYAGRESAPSPVAEVTTTGATSVVNVSALEDVRWSDGGTLRESGIIRRIYRRDKTNAGPWVMVGDVESSVVTSPYLTDSALLPDGADRESLTVLNIPATWQTIRPWQTPNADQTWALRYRYEPPPLIADNDAPILPRPYHSLITYRVLADLLSGGESAKYERRYSQLYGRCEDNHLDRTESRHRMASWTEDLVSAGRPGFRGRNLGIPTLS